MPIQQGKLYRSGINYHPKSKNRQRQDSLNGDYFQQNLNSKQNFTKNALIQSASQSSLKRNIGPILHQQSRQTVPYLKGNDAQNTSFLSIDDAYLNPKFQKKRQSNQEKILTNMTQMHFDTQSIGGRSIKTHQGTDEYYKYWKSKAHQYLEENFKLRQQNKKIKGQLQTLQKNQKQQKNQLPPLPLAKSQNNSQNRIRQQKSFSYLQNIFKKKLDEMENELKQKNIKIQNLQDKVLQLNRKILGQQQRTQLITRLGEQVDTLSQQNIALKKQIYQIQAKQKKQQQLQIQSNSPQKRYRSKQKNYFNMRKSPDKINKK